MVEVTGSPEGWKTRKLGAITQGTQIHPPIVIGDHIYMLANENANHKGEERKTGGLMCLGTNGVVKWNTGVNPFMGRGNMMYVQGKLLIQDGELGYLRVVEPSPNGYKELSFADIFDKKAAAEKQIAEQKGSKKVKLPSFKFWSPMALSNGILIMRAQDTMKCLDLR